MSVRLFVGIATTVGALGAVLVAGTLINPPRGHAQSNGNNFDLAKVEKGFDIAPVTLTYPREKRNLVGYGSWLVNAVADCNGCHTAGPPPNFNYANGFNPYFGQKPTKLDPTVYLGGGQEFGQVGFDPTTFALQGPVIVARNLTPDYTGRAEGGNTFDDFKMIIRTGADLDHLHPPCTGTNVPANCIIPPTDGNVLQVMPWPVFNNMSDEDLLAIYSYLSAVPCYPGPATVSDLPPEQQYAFAALHNDCAK
jgi:hypothetical protein